MLSPAELAYRITDTGASGRIVESPLGLQEGAEKLAKAENIVEVRLNQNSTPQQFVMSFFDKIILGVVESVLVKEEDRVKLGSPDS
jgi:hypothetical protein